MPPHCPATVRSTSSYLVSSSAMPAHRPASGPRAPQRRPPPVYFRYVKGCRVGVKGSNVEQFQMRSRMSRLGGPRTEPAAFDRVVAAKEPATGDKVLAAAKPHEYIPRSASGLGLCCEHVLQKCDDTVFCGWSLEFVGLVAGWLVEPWQRHFFTISSDGTCTSWEVEWGRAPRINEAFDPYRTLRCFQRLDLLQLRAMRREAPDSEHDFSFRLSTPELTVRIDPQTWEAYARWETAVMRAVACRECVSQRERLAAEERAARAAAAAARYMAIFVRRIQRFQRRQVQLRLARRTAAAQMCQRAVRARLARRLMHALREYSRLRGMCIGA